MNPEEMHPELKKFIEFIGSVVKSTEDEFIITQKVAHRMKELMQNDQVIPKVYKQPNPDKYTLYPIYVDPNNSFSIASAVWDVGQSTPIHNHGTWGVIGIIQGGEHEIHYDISSNTVPVMIEERILKQGDVIVCCTTDQDIHKVSCATKIPCVGLHVYGGNIGEIERYVFDSDTGEKKRVVTSWDPVPSS